MLADWRKAGGLGSALKWFKVMASDLMGKDDVGACLPFSSSPPPLPPLSIARVSLACPVFATSRGREAPARPARVLCGLHARPRLHRAAVRAHRAPVLLQGHRAALRDRPLGAARGAREAEPRAAAVARGCGGQVSFSCDCSLLGTYYCRLLAYLWLYRWAAGSDRLSSCCISRCLGTVLAVYNAITMLSHHREENERTEYDTRGMRCILWVWMQKERKQWGERDT